MSSSSPVWWRAPSHTETRRVSALTHKETVLVNFLFTSLTITNLFPGGGGGEILNKDDCWDSQNTIKTHKIHYIITYPQLIQNNAKCQCKHVTFSSDMQAVRFLPLILCMCVCVCVCVCAVSYTHLTLPTRR